MGSDSRGKDTREPRHRSRRRYRQGSDEEESPAAADDEPNGDQANQTIGGHIHQDGASQVQQQDDENQQVYDQNRNLNLEEVDKQLSESRFESQQANERTAAPNNELAASRGALLNHDIRQHKQQNIARRCSSTSPEISESLSSSASATTTAINGSNDDCSSRSTAPTGRVQVAVQDDCPSAKRSGVQVTATSDEYQRLLSNYETGHDKTEFELQPTSGGNGVAVIPINDHEQPADILQQQLGCAISKPQNHITGSGRGFINQWGRRMSALPQLFARRMSNQKDEAQTRRFSLQHSQSVVSTTTTTATSTSIAIHDQQQQPAPPPLTAVAGVGGTITTVTRSKRKTAPLPRLVGKNGQVNLFLDNIDRRQYVRDLFTTMIDIKWRYNLMAAAFGFVFSWILFACIWYLVLYFHQDLEHENDPNWSPCIVNVYSFPAALLFSIETQSTLGFGSRIISVECPGAIVIFCIQLIFGVVVECLIVGMVFAKLSRPAKRSQTIMYSKYATVCLRESKMCLMFRVGDVRSKSHVIGATIRASLVSQKITAEGETIPFYHHQLKVRIDDSRNSLLLIWPVTIVHIIDESSPFFRLNSEQLANFKFEIITVLEGTVESTGQSIQVRSSYLPSEVKWGYRFEPIVSTHGFGRCAQTIIDYNKFNHVVKVDTPDCSAMDYYARQQSDGLETLQEEASEADSGDTPLDACPIEGVQ